MGFDYWAAKRDGVKDDEINEYLKQTTGKGFDFVAARKSGIKNDEIAEYLNSAVPEKSKHSWRADGVPDAPNAKPKYNTSAVAAAPGLFKEAPDDVKADAAAGAAMKAIDTLHNSKPASSIVEKAYNYANSVLQKGKFAIDTVKNGLFDGITANTIADTAKEHLSSDKETMSKINALKTGFSDEDLIGVKQIYNPSKQTILSDILGDKPVYTEDAAKRYGDNLISAFGDRYFVKLTVGDDNKITPWLKPKDDENAVWQEPKADGIGSELYNSLVASLPISGTQAASGMAAEKIARPIAKAANNLPGVWGKIAGTAVRGAAFGFGAAIATPAGVALKNATNEGEWNTEDAIAESLTEAKDSALFDTVATGGGVIYHAVKPNMPNIKKALGDTAEWTVGRYLDGNSPSIDKVMKTAGVTPEEVAEYQVRRAKFESVPPPDKLVNLSNTFKEMKYVGKPLEMGADALNTFKRSDIDAKRQMALDATLGGDNEGTMLRHLTETMQEFPEAGDKMSRTVSARAASLKKEFDSLLTAENGEALRPLELVRNDIGVYKEAVSQNFENMKATWRELFPEKIDLAEASGLKNIADELAQSISKADIATAKHLDSMSYLLEKGGDISDLFTLRRDLNKLSDAPATHEGREAIKAAKSAIDEYMQKAVTQIDEKSGNELMRATKDAYGEWAYLKDMEDTPLFAKTQNGSLSEDDFVKFATKEAGASELDNLRPLLDRVSPQTKETLENSILAKIVNDGYKEVGAGAKYIDWQAVGDKLSKIDNTLFTTKSAKENYETLKEAANVFKTDKVMQNLASGISSGTHSAGLATTIQGAAERLWVSRAFKRLMMYMPTAKSENMAFRLQLSKAIEGARTPLEMLSKIEKSSSLPNYVKEDFAKIKDDFSTAVPKIKAELQAAMEADMSKANFDAAKKEWDELVKQGELLAMRDEARASNKLQAFDYMAKKGLSAEEIAKKLMLKRAEGEEFPYYVGNDGVVFKKEPFAAMDAYHGEKINPSPKLEDIHSPIETPAAEVKNETAVISEYKAKESLYTKDFAQALAAKEPDGELAKHLDKIISGEVDEAAAKAYLDAIEPYTPAELHTMRKELANETKVAPAQETAVKEINKDEAKEVSEALYFADNTAYKEFGKKQGTLDKLFGDIAEGKELTTEQKALYADIEGYAKESGALDKYKAEKEAAHSDNIAKLDDIGEYLAKTAEEREAVEAEARRINEIVAGRLISNKDMDIEETLKGMGIFEKIKHPEDAALDEMAPKWANEIKPKADRYYEKYKDKEIAQLERIHAEALERLTQLQDRLYAYDTQAKALADTKAIAKTQDEIGKLKAVEWASGGILKAAGGSGMLGGMVNGLEYDNDGNITGVDAEKFLVGFVGGALAGAILKGKVGQKTIETATKKLEPLKELAVNEGNALAAKLHDKLMSSYFAPVLYMAPAKDAGQKEIRGIHNVTYNGKNSTRVKKYDLDALDDYIKYERGNQFKGAIHIQKHLEDGSVGEVLPEELSMIGKIIRDGTLHLEDGRNVYTYYKDDVRFRVVTAGDKTEKVITFYSDRNLNKTGRNGIDNSVLPQPSDKDVILHQDGMESQAMKAALPIAGAAIASGDGEDGNGMLAGIGGVMAFRGGKTLPKGFFSKLEQVADEKLPSRFGEQTALNILKKNGVKDEELRWANTQNALSVLKDEKGLISKNDFSEWLRLNRVQLVDTANVPTKYEEFKLPQTQNYREILISAPEMKKGYKNTHWNDPKTLMHIRAGDMELDGQKTLMIEEIQSDLHQAGRKGASVPDAPLARTWHEYGIKKMIAEAVDGEYERVAWTTADTQNKRNGLARIADEVVYNDKSKVIEAKRNGVSVVFKLGVESEDLPSIVGKDLAQKLMDETPTAGGGRKLVGEELKVGGDGMEGFYNKILPDFTRRYIKKYGSELETKTLSDGTEVWSFAVTPKMAEDIKANGQPLYAAGGGMALAASASSDTDKDPAKAFTDKWKDNFGLKEKAQGLKETVKKIFTRDNA